MVCLHLQQQKSRNCRDKDHSRYGSGQPKRIKESHLFILLYGNER